MIDIHTHLHPPRLFAAIRRWFAEHSSWDLSAQPSEPAEVAIVLRAAGVERFVFCSYAHKPAMARTVNAWLVETARTLGGYGIPLATVHLDDPDYIDDLRIALDGGCAGLKLHEDVQQLACDDQRFDPIYRELARRKAFLLVHVGPIPWAHLEGDGAQRVDRLLQRHPTLNVVVAHMGVPDTNEYFSLMTRHPTLHLDTTMVLAKHSPMEARAKNIAVDSVAIERHADRILYGTDFPNVPYNYDSELRGVESLGLSDAALRAILHDNAKRLLGAQAVA